MIKQGERICAEDPSVAKFFKLVMPVVQRVGHCMITEVGDVPCYVRLATNTIEGGKIDKEAFAELVVPPPQIEGDDVDTKEDSFVCAHGDNAKHLVARFVCDLPEAEVVFWDDRLRRIRRLRLHLEEPVRNLPLNITSIRKIANDQTAHGDSCRGKVMYE